MSSVAVMVEALTRLKLVSARSQMVVGDAVTISVAALCTSTLRRYLSTGYWLAVPKFQGSSFVLSPSRSRSQLAYIAPPVPYAVGVCNSLVVLPVPCPVAVTPDVVVSQ